MEVFDLIKIEVIKIEIIIIEVIKIDAIKIGVIKWSLKILQPLELFTWDKTTCVVVFEAKQHKYKMGDRDCPVDCSP